MSGIFISFEGPDGAGKTTVMSEVAKKLAKLTERKITMTREPGGSNIAEKIRGLILDPENVLMDDWTEALLYAASRRQHLIEIIRPALDNGDIVLCDRYVDSSIAYQGGGDNLGEEKVAALNSYAIEGLMPEQTVYIDIPVEVGMKRIGKIGAGFDRLESKKLAFHEQTRAAYLKLAADNPQRIVKFDGTQDVATVIEQVMTAIVTKFRKDF